MNTIFYPSLFIAGMLAATTSPATGTGKLDSLSPCQTLEIRFAVVDEQDSTRFRVTVTNPTSSEVELPKTFFWASEMGFEIKTSEGKALLPMYPLISPGATRVIVPAGGERTEAVSLSRAFRELQAERSKGTVTLGWKVQVEPLGATCGFVAKGKATLAQKSVSSAFR